MTPSIITDDFLDVTDLAKVAGCNYSVWFGRSLWDWCQQPETATGLWSKAGGLLCSLSCIPDETLRVGGPVKLKTAGEKVVVDLVSWVSPSDTRVIYLSLSGFGQHGRPANRIAATISVRPKRAERKPESIPFYFLCGLCDAKWFAEARAACCPRCRTPGRSQEQVAPPWWQGRT